MEFHLITEEVANSKDTLARTEHTVFALTSSGCITQLLADHTGINTAPVIMTHCPPLVIDAHLHSTFILTGASHQTNISISTDSTGIY